MNNGREQYDGKNQDRVHTPQHGKIYPAIYLCPVSSLMADLVNEETPPVLIGGINPC
jgi:hypothetical protein